MEHQFLRKDTFFVAIKWKHLSIRAGSLSNRFRGTLAYFDVMFY